MSKTHDEILDELLVFQCQDGDGNAFKTLIERWQPRLSRLAWRLTGEREAARDIVQDTWLAIVRGLRRLDDPARFRSWAYRIVSNKCADWTRRRVVLRNAAQDMKASAARVLDGRSNDEHSADEVSQMRHALTRLPDDQRAILALHYLDGMRMAQIARVLGVPQGTVKSRLHHARNRLRQSLERMEI